MAILNQRDYRTARARIAQLSKAVGTNALISELTEHLPADVSRARQETLKSELVRLEKEVAEYEALLSKDAAQEHIIDIDDLGYLPILARIARGYSQRELASLLDIKEQQIQRYESERYSGISLTRYQKLLDTLGIELHPKLAALEKKTSASAQESLFQADTELIREIRKRNWIDLDRNATPEHAREIISSFVDDSLRALKGEALYKKTTSTKLQTNESALRAWRARISQIAQRQKGYIRGKFNLAETSWIKKLVSLSVFPDGPVRAVEMLRDKGIQFAIEPSLPKTNLDGAAIQLTDGTPVVGLTLRHDRVDNFWFSLLHELGHIYLHYNRGLAEGFFDDFDDEGETKVEHEADSFARSQLIPDESWNSSPAKFAKSEEVIREFAQSLNVHPAIVAGRIRRERKNYKVFDGLVGRDQVRRLFAQSMS